MLRSFNENSLENAAIENSNVKMKRSTGRRKHKRRNNIRNKRRKPHNRRKKNRKRKTKKRQNITRRNNRNRKTRKIKSMRQSIVFTGESCQYVDFGSVRSSGSGCADGTKMVLKNQWDIFHPSISRYYVYNVFVSQGWSQQEAVSNSRQQNYLRICCEGWKIPNLFFLYG